MLNALRRIRAETKPDKKKRGAINLPAFTLTLVQDFAKKLGMSVPLLLKCMTECVRSDQASIEKVVRLAVAIRMKPLGAPQLSNTQKENINGK